MAQLIETLNRCTQERWIPPAVAIAAFNLDFLCIHPFRDGNGRVSRLALLLHTYHAGMKNAGELKCVGRGVAARWSLCQMQ